MSDIKVGDKVRITVDEMGAPTGSIVKVLAVEGPYSWGCNFTYNFKGRKGLMTSSTTCEKVQK